MVKQGQFAKSKRIRHLKSLRIKRHPNQGRTIANEQFPEFLLGRYVLTTRKDLPAEARESGQRLLQELGPRLLENGGNEQAAVVSVLHFALGRVPWQVYWQVSQSWDQLQAFLKREVPAVPLAERLRLSQLLSQTDLDKIMINLLAKQAAVATTLNQGDKLRQMMAQRLSAAIQKAQGGIDWEKVRQLIGPLPFDPQDADDQGTRVWLTKLQDL